MSSGSDTNQIRAGVRGERSVGGAEERPIEVAGRLLASLLLLLLALAAAAALVPFDAEPYDEGLMATGGALAVHGKLPGVDYYAPYPPGAFVTLGLAFRLWGVRLLVERWYAAGLAALIGALGFWLITGFRPDAERPGWRKLAAPWLVCLAIAFLVSTRWVTPVNGGALVLVLATGIALRAALPRGRLRDAFFCGGLAGATALWRLDFGAYVAVATIGVWLLHAGGSERDVAWRRRLPGAAALCFGVLFVSLPPLVWIVARGGHRAFASLFLWPLTSTAAAHLPWIHYWSAFLLPLAAVGLLFEAQPSLREERDRAAVAHWLLFVGLGFLVYSLGRTHATHLLPLRAISLLLGAVVVGVRRPRASASRLSGTGAVIPAAGRESSSPLLPWPGLALTACVLSLSVGPVHEYFHALRLPARRRVSLPGPRGAGIYPPSRRAWEYRRIVPYLRDQIPAGARLFCAAPRHDCFMKSDNLAYFLADRESGTYYWCLDAGVTSTRAVQQEMVQELEAARVPVVLIHSEGFNHEPNAGGRCTGSHLLDDYLRRQFQAIETWPCGQICRRRAIRKEDALSRVRHDPAAAIREDKQVFLAGQDQMIVAGRFRLVR